MAARRLSGLGHHFLRSSPPSNLPAARPSTLISTAKMSSFADQHEFRLNHTMFRIKDPKVSLSFYQDILGMKLINQMDAPEAKFTNYFLAFPTRDGSKPASQYDREGILELCHNYGTEDDANFKYHNGNDQPQGFGHIAITVNDIEAACKYFEEKGVNFKKRLTDGRMKNIAFILDPDNYWIEIVANKR